jgi:hypothetical protein
MKAILVGKEIVSYTKTATGEVKEGISLYYNAGKPDVEGLVAASLWIPRRSAEIYKQIEALDLSKPVNANVVNEVPPGGRFPVLTEIEILPAAHVKS